ncbi:protein HEXIM1-like [Tubulanus polymorphus]|uniref:protein HEXIM1-like n=1 Tax=Tubulanus polymorphus TaxID=672921 RepID=UPI003DA6BC6D
MDVDQFKVPSDISVVRVSVSDDERVDVVGVGDRSPDDELPSSGGDEATEPGGVSSANGRNKKRHRRGKHKGGSKHAKKWRPYNKLTWEERKELDDKESKRATLKREERFLHGHPVAPYNTTQFLMDEHSKNENISPFVKNDVPEVTAAPLELGAGGEDSSDSAGGVGTGADDEDTFLRNDFSETYENIHAERLQAMSKQELIQDYLDLEVKVERLENRVKDLEERQEKQLRFTCCELKENVLFRPDNSLLKLLKDEIEHLKGDNEKLRKDNSQLSQTTKS